MLPAAGPEPHAEVMEGHALGSLSRVISEASGTDVHVARSSSLPLGDLWQVWAMGWVFKMDSLMCISYSQIRVSFLISNPHRGTWVAQSV